MRLLGSDLDGPDIARQLSISLSTVRTHTQHIYAKLGVNNRRRGAPRPPARLSEASPSRGAAQAGSSPRPRIITALITCDDAPSSPRLLRFRTSTGAHHHPAGRDKGAVSGRDHQG